MTDAYRILYNYAFQLTGDRDQAKKIVDFVILEGDRKIEQGNAKEDVEAFITAEVRRMSYEYTEKQNNAI